MTGRVWTLMSPWTVDLHFWVVHGEVPGRWALVGAVLILGSTSLKAGLALRRPSAGAP